MQLISYLTFNGQREATFQKTFRAARFGMLVDRLAYRGWWNVSKVRSEA